MNRVNNELIEHMVGDLTPVSPIRPVSGWLAVALALIMTVLAVTAIGGLWPGIASGEASAYYFIVQGLLLVLGIAAAANVIAMASPRVGNRYDSAKWALAMVAVLPLAALASLVGASDAMASLGPSHGMVCVTLGLLCSLLIGGVLTLWLRRGAPVSLKTAGWQTGVAAGALGVAAFALSCPLDDIVHLGIFHVVPVALAGIIGALIVPRLVRW